MINILAWADVANKYRITSDTAKGRFITVHLSENRRMNFVEVESRLHLFRDRVQTLTNNKMSGYSYLMLTEANLKDFTKDEVKRAQRVRDQHIAVGFPGYKKFLWLRKKNKVIYGEEVAVLKGKQYKKTQSKTHCSDRGKLPRDILQKYNKIHITVDHMFVQGV